MNGSDDRSPARTIGLFFVLVVLVNGLILPGSSSAADLQSTFALAFFLHAGLTLYDGYFDATRTITWILCIAGWLGLELVGFLNFVIPWGQLGFWLAVKVQALPVIGTTAAPALAATTGLPTLLSLLLLCLLCIDIATMHRNLRHRYSAVQIVVFLVAVTIGALLMGVALGALADLLLSGVRGAGAAASAVTPIRILPFWYELPLYALLRSIPNKSIGVAVMFAAMLVPVVWPWVHADALRKGSLRRVWLSLCLILAGVWIALGYLGSRLSDPVVIVQSQILAAYYFAFFLVVPFVIRRYAALLRDGTA
jgi:ubiquinol-cytochrome c reductase cytochrome b/c1 subunit